MKEQHVPIFVGSTFEDLQEHRKKVREALNRLGTYVNGMEQFGATTESPLDTCLAEVRASRIYVGIFGMRYGSIPEGYEKSFTHLEYEEAQKLKLPSLIFIFDEKTPVLTAYIDTDEKNPKLKLFKKQLLASNNTHTCDFFSTPDDLATKVSTAVAKELRKLEVRKEIEIEDGLEEAIPQQSTLPAATILRRANILPKRWDGIEFVAEFCNASQKPGYFISPQESSEGYCRALGIPHGHSVTVKWASKENPSECVEIYAANELADQVIDIDKISIIKAKVETTYLYIDDDWDSKSKTVLSLKEILCVTEYCDIPF